MTRPFDPTDEQIDEAALFAATEEDVSRLAVELAAMQRDRDALRADLDRTVADVLAVVEGREPETWAWPLHALRDALVTARAERDALRAEVDRLRETRP